MSEQVSVELATQTVVACEVCGRSGDVPWYCKNCPGSLCDTCKEAHRETAISRTHAVVPRTGEVLRLHGPARIAEQCSKHKTKEISTYCNECQVACCVTCLAERHKRHDFSPIEDIYLSAEKRLNDYIKQLQGDVKPKLQYVVNQTEEMTESIANHIQTTKDEVDEFRREVKQVVDKAFDAIIDTLEKPNTDLSKIQCICKTQIQKVEELVSECTNRIREGKLDIIKYTPPCPTTYIPKINLPEASYPFFIPKREILNSLERHLGTIKYSSKTTTESENVMFGRTELKFDKKIISVKKMYSFKSKIDATSITTAGNNTAWVMDDDSDTMYLYSDSGEVVISVTVMKGVGIKNMVIASSGDMIVTNSDQKVRCVSVSGIVSTLLNTTPFGVGGVCLTDAREIMVCMDAQEKRNHVAVYSSDGHNKLREIRCQDDQGKHLITDPYRVIQNGEDLCVVNDKEVVCVGEKGDLRWVYDGKQVMLEDEFDPRGICRDKYHNLLVTDYNNHCVHYIDREGQLIQIILTQKQIGLWYHWGISVNDETGQVWVGNGGSEDVVVATYLKRN